MARIGRIKRIKQRANPQITQIVADEKNITEKIKNHRPRITRITQTKEGTQGKT